VDTDQFGTFLDVTARLALGVTGGGSIARNRIFTDGNTPGGTFKVTAAERRRERPGQRDSDNTRPSGERRGGDTSPVTGHHPTVSALGADNGANRHSLHGATRRHAASRRHVKRENGTNERRSAVATSRGRQLSLMVTIQDDGNLTTTSRG